MPTLFFLCRLRQVSKSVAHRKTLTEHRRKCFLFENMEDEELSAVVDVFQKKSIPARFVLCPCLPRAACALPASLALALVPACACACEGLM